MASKQRKRKTKQPARFDGFVPVDNALLDTILESSKGDNDGESDDGSLINWSGSSGSESSEEDLRAKLKMRKSVSVQMNLLSVNLVIDLDLLVLEIS